MLPREAPRLGPPLAAPEEPRATGPGEGMMVRIERVAVQGNTALPDAALRPLLDGLQGRSVPLSAVEEARFAVLRAYREAGYAYAAVAAGLAPLPGGAAELRIEVTEGFVAEVKLDGDIGPAATQVLRFLNRLVGQRPVTTAALERALLLASDVPGVTARGVLRPLPGEPGAMQLLVQLQRRTVSGFFNLDNRGFTGTGAWQGLLVAGVNSLTSLGERTEFAILQGEANNQTFGQVSEEVFVGGSGLRVRLFAGLGQARPGSTLAAIGYRGDTWLAGAVATYPVVRSRPFNLTLSGQFDAFESTVDTRTGPGGSSQRASRDAVRAVRFGAEAAVRDALLGGLLADGAAASTFGYVRVHQGVETFGASRTGSASVGRIGADFSFTKLTGEVTRLQPLFRPFDGAMVSLQGTLAGQYSADILPSSEKFYLGGTRLGRGYYSGQVSGDSAIAGSVELQLSTGVDVPLPAAWSGNAWLGGGPLAPWLGSTEVALSTQFYLFHDQGRAFENKPTDPDRRLSSWGGGVRAIVNDRLQFDVEGVHRLTRNPDGAATRSLASDAVFARFLVRF